MVYIHGIDSARWDRRLANRGMPLCCVCRDRMRKSLAGHCGGILAVKEHYMRILIVIISVLLWLWFLGCTFTWRFGKVLLVEGMGIKSIEFAVLVLFSIGIITYMLWEPVGRWVLMVELALWLIVQFFCHEYFTIFGASAKKLDSYNRCFEGTVKLFPASKTRLVPDLYHIVLHILIAIDLVLVIGSLI